jgi:hypothetical protein
MTISIDTTMEKSGKFEIKKQNPEVAARLIKFCLQGVVC